MTRATQVIGRGGWTDQPVDSVVLGLEERRARRGAVQGVRALAFELALPDMLTLRTGDALKLEDGRLVEVVAAPEPLIELRFDTALDLARAAWHFGNRHAPMQILGQKLRVRDDADAAAVAAHLGLKARSIEAPFDPEGGAYAPETIVEHAHGQACGCGHHHHDGHDHHHDHGHHHDHAHHDHAHHDHGHHDHAAHDHAGHDHAAGCCGGHAGKHDHHGDHAHAHDHHAGGCCGGHGHKHA